jgi:hypothetical protein
MSANETLLLDALQSFVDLMEQGGLPEDWQVARLKGRAAIISVTGRPFASYPGEDGRTHDDMPGRAGA